MRASTVTSPSGSLLTVCGLATAVAVFISLGPEAVAPDPDRAASTGLWRVAAVEVNGLPVDAEIAAMLSVVYAVDGRWRVFFKSIPVAEGESSNDPSTSPKSFEMQTRGPPDGSRAGDRYVGIYEADGNMRRFCFVPADRPRPDAFTTSRGSGRILVTLARP